ncbi:hypothetical protein KKG58_05610 [Patescibacteria group bacterium]|nr:hypothetical protein [Patescibacteria group bacterium]
MGDFKQDRRKSSSGGYGGGFGRQDGGRSNFSRGGSGGRDRGPVTMHQAVCDQCGKSCEVPFRPTEGKPVYCNACYGGKKEGGDIRGGDRYSKRGFDSHKTSSRTDFGSNANRGNDNEIKKQLEILNVKMDKLIKVVEAITNIKPLVVEKKVEESVKNIPVVKVKKSVKKVAKKTKK